MRRPVAAGLALLLVTVTLAVNAAAEPHVRNGLYAGFGYGGNWAKLELANSQKAEWTGTWSVRAGWALKQDLLLGAEYTRWAKDYAIATLQGDIPYEVTLSGAVMALTYFPGNEGFMLRVGGGVAMAEINITPPPQFSIPAESISPDPGFALLAGLGYEARLTEKFALGADFSMLYLAVSDAGFDRAYVYGLNVDFNWYW